MDDYPNAPAMGKTDTSAAAAEAIGTVSARVQRAVLHAVYNAGERGLTSHELAVTLGMERTTVQPRTTELRRLGKLRDSGQRRPNPNGKRAIVWAATAGGQA